jgi:phosphatidate cytidylyltransferase
VSDERLAAGTSDPARPVVPPPPLRFDPVRKAKLPQRVAGGLTALIALGATLGLDHRFAIPWCSLVLVTLLGVIAAFELVRMLGALPVAAHPRAFVAAAASFLVAKGALLAAGHHADGFALLAIGLFLLLGFAVEVVGGDARRGVERVAYSLLAFGYVVLYSFLLDLLLLPSAPRGVELALFLVLTSKANDIGGYLVGSLVGGRRLAPKVSGGKTWAGALGGLALGVAVAWFGGDRFALPPGLALAFGVLVAIATQFGDLAESLLKRACGFKDSGRLLPTFGGALDVVDSLVFAAPCGYALLVVFRPEVFAP